MRLRTLREQAALNTPEGAAALERLWCREPRGLTQLWRKVTERCRKYSGQMAYRVWRLFTPSISQDNVVSTCYEAIEKGRLHHLRMAVKFLPPSWMRRLRPDDNPINSLLRACGLHDNQPALRILAAQSSRIERQHAWYPMVEADAVACEQLLWEGFTAQVRLKMVTALLERMTERYYGSKDDNVNACMQNIADRLTHQDLLRALPPDRLSMDGRGQALLHLCQQRLRVLEDQEALDEVIPTAGLAPARVRPRL